MAIENWMSWCEGVDLCGSTAGDPAAPNLILHVASQVHTPVGSAPAGMVFWQPDASAPPSVVGFLCSNAEVGAYFGPRIFAGTPFENAPVLDGKIEIESDAPHHASSRIEVAGQVFEARLEGLTELELTHRDPSEGAPFVQQGLESSATRVSLRVNGQDVALTLPPAGPTGGPAAAWAPTGLYAR